ncbi:MAG: ribose 5-phosphate isomerase B [Ignavibacteriales bacterium]|nr:ribose 5-phosphate isomerase B [Ignavibacteriales bacterium]
MKIALASDHAGFEYKEKVKQLLSSLNIPFEDFGTNSTDSVDYPDYSHKASQAVSNGYCERGILVCGAGIGMSIVANKHKGVRAAVCESVESAKLARQHNDANVLCFGARITEWNVTEQIVKVFLETEFEGGRHSRRVEKIHLLTSL